MNNENLFQFLKNVTNSSESNINNDRDFIIFLIRSGVLSKIRYFELLFDRKIPSFSFKAKGYVINFENHPDSERIHLHLVNNGAGITVVYNSNLIDIIDKSTELPLYRDYNLIYLALKFSLYQILTQEEIDEYGLTQEYEQLKQSIGLSEDTGV